MRKTKDFELHKKKKKWLLVCTAIALGFTLLIIFFMQPENDNKIENNGIKKIDLQDSASSTINRASKPNDAQVLAEGEGLEIIKAHCTSCHSAKLIVQNRATREGWLNMIRWMQQTQNLWDLGENEEIILNYLSTHYAPEDKGRRENLKDIEWYEFNDE